MGKGKKPTSTKPRTNKKDYDDDDVYNESDRHAGLHMIGMDDDDNEKNKDDIDNDDLEEVFRLQDDDDDDIDDDDEDDDDDVDDMSSDDEEARQKAIDRENKMLTAWGKNKKSFYNHDDEVEIDEEAAQEEEKEVRRLQKKRITEIDEDDITFGSSVAAIKTGTTIVKTNNNNKDTSTVPSNQKSSSSSATDLPSSSSTKKSSSYANASSGIEKITKDTRGLSKSEKLDILMADTPELLDLLKEMQEKSTELQSKISPILEAAESGRLNTTTINKGLSYLEVKQQLLLSYITNITFVLLLKAEGKSIRDHPVIPQLLHIRTLLEKIRPLDKRMQSTITKLLKAARNATATTDNDHNTEDNDNANDNDDDEENDENIDYSDIKNHPRSIQIMAKKQMAGIDLSNEERSARPNPGALLYHGDGGLALDNKKGSKKSNGKSLTTSTTLRSSETFDDDDDNDDDDERMGEREKSMRNIQGVVDSDGIYRPLRRTAVPYDDNNKRSKAEREAERTRNRLAKNTLLTDLRNTYSEAPEEDDVTGTGSAAFAKNAKDDALDRLAEDRRQFEEDNFVRLSMSKDEKKARKARAREVERWDNLAELEQFGEIDALSRKLDEADEIGNSTNRKLKTDAGQKVGRSLAQIEAENRAKERSLTSISRSAASELADNVGTKRTRASGVANLPLHDDDDGDDFNEEDEEDYGSSRRTGSKHQRDYDEDEEEDPFYAAVEAAAAKKRAKKAQQHQREADDQADFIRNRRDAYELDEERTNGHRKISRDIEKNRGLTKYRKREERNPRVHNRKKAEKFMKRRQGQVQNMRDSAQEAGRYGGESSGIRTNISRSTKIKY